MGRRRFLAAASAGAAKLHPLAAAHADELPAVARVAMLGAALLALAATVGCGKSTQSAASGGAAANVGAAPAAPVAPSSGPAWGSTTDTTKPITLAKLPAPSAGEWSLVARQNGGAPVSSKTCFDGKPIDPTSGMVEHCEKLDAVRTADGGFQVTGECSNNGVTTTLLMRGVGDFRTSFYTDTEVKNGAHSATTNNSTYTYLGPTCAR